MKKKLVQWKIALCIMLLFICWSLFSCFAQASSDTPPKKSGSLLIIDTDANIDDWFAILYLLNCREVNLLGITVAGAGGTHLKPGARIVLNLLSLAGRDGEDIPVALGDEAPLDGYNEFPASLREQIDSMCGVDLPQNSRQPVDKHAVDLLFSLLQTAEKSVDILTLGPLTNIAKLIGQHPEIKDKIRRIIIMGGAVHVKGNLIIPHLTEHLKNEVAEWNIHIDPLAAQMVFRSGIPLTLVPLDATNSVQITKEFTEQHHRHAKSPEAKFIDRVFLKTKHYVDSGGWYFWDPLAAAIAVNPELCERYELLSLDVIAEYAPHPPEGNLPDFPKANHVGQVRRPFEAYRSGQTMVSEQGGKVLVCLSVRGEKFKDHFMAVINGD